MFHSDRLLTSFITGNITLQAVHAAHLPTELQTVETEEHSVRYAIIVSLIPFVALIDLFILKRKSS